MIEQLRVLLAERRFSRAVIIDDAFDDRPRVGDIHAPGWDRFFDDLGEDDEDALQTAFGTEAYAASDVAALAREQRFMDVVWEARGRIAAAAALFADFEVTQERKRTQLEPLRALLEGPLGLTCTTHGREEGVDFRQADIVFLDLFLGFSEDETAIARSIERVKAIAASRPATPPSVVLLSANPMLERVGPRLRDDAELLGSQFRMIRKSELLDADLVVERLYDLAVSYPDALRLNEFLLAWDRALTNARITFLRSVRTLDLADYANMQALILEAEDQPVGDYVLDLYDLHLHNVLEGDRDLVRAAAALNEIVWVEYPPAQFMPSPEVIGLMDGALFHNEARTDVEAEIGQDPKKVRLGDVFLGPTQPAGAAAPETAKRHAYVVLSQACDLQHGEADRLLLLKGDLRPYDWKLHDGKAQGPRTPVMLVRGQAYAVDWDVLAPETWLLADLAAKLVAGFTRVRRLRTPFALQLQQAFIGRLGRVGTIAALPARYRAGVRVFLRDRTNKAHLLVSARADEEKAVCLVGRTGKNALKEWLLLADDLRTDLRRAIREFPEGELPPGSNLDTFREDPAFFRRFKGGLALNREAAKGSKPFKDTGHDVVQILTRRTLEAGGDADRSFHPILVEVDLSEVDEIDPR